ncbi:glutathione S-transferase [Ceratobasidium sp. AG-Ba]|nr:glutathione S-transferase [Ceratobasidium sp. AG-Ba]
MTEAITLYSSEYCPFAQRTVIALQEANADYTKYEVDLINKPAWYAPKVNPASKVPAIAYGGPKTDPTDPSPESVKLAESLILLEFIADLFPNSGLLSSDPVQRAQTRFVIDVFSNKFMPAYFGFVNRGESPEPLYAALLALQEHLVHAQPFLGGDRLNIADAAIAPFALRLNAQLKNDVGIYAEGQGPQVHAEIFGNARFATFQKYFNALSERQTVKNSFPEEKYLNIVKQRLNGARKSAA